MDADADDGPIGATVAHHAREQRARSRRYRDVQDRLRPFEEVARIVIMRRAQLGLTQQALADRMGTTSSVISRIESGQHPSSLDTLRRLAHVLGDQVLTAFEFPDGDGSSPSSVGL